MKWITREHVKVDRVACPWLIKKFVDRDAEFIFVQPDKVVDEVKRLNAIPYDVKNVELGHHGKECSFEAILKKYKLSDDPALVLLGKIVNGADTDNSLYQQPEAPGLKAIAEGFRLTQLFCWRVASSCSARCKPSPISSASRFCRYGTFAFPRRGACKGHGPASFLPMHRLVRLRLAHSRSNSPASRRPRLICVSRSDSRGLRGDPRCRSTCGGTSGWRTIGLPASRRAHVATSAPFADFALAGRFTSALRGTPPSMPPMPWRKYRGG